MQVVTFIMQNRYIYSISRYAPCKIDMGKDELYSYTEVGFFTIRCSNRFWGGVWSDMTTEQVLLIRTKWFLVGSHEGAELQRTLWVSRCVPVRIPRCTPNWRAQWQPGVFWAVLWGMSPQRLETFKQADLGQFMWSIGAHLLLYGHYHGNLVSLSSGITGDSSVNCHNAEEVGQQLQQQVVRKSLVASKMKRMVKVMTLEAMGNSIIVHGQEGIVNPQPFMGYASCKSQLICHLSWCMTYLLLFYQVALHCTAKVVMRSLLASLV